MGQPSIGLVGEGTQDYHLRRRSQLLDSARGPESFNVGHDQISGGRSSHDVDESGGEAWTATGPDRSEAGPALSARRDRGVDGPAARTIARALASRRVSPKGPGSGLRMLLFFINRAGRGLAPGRRADLEKAKRLMQERPGTNDRGSTRTRQRP